MATAAGRRLAQAHRVAQLRIGAETVGIISAAWPLLDPTDPKGTARGWLSVVEPAIQAQRAKSARLAGRFFTAHRMLELDDSFDAVLAGDAPAVQVRTSMLVTGVYHLLANLGRGVVLDRASAIAKASSAAAAMRLALEGGRETLTSTIKADPRARGYERVTSGNSCDFCEMLADRGAVYGEASADFEAHDHCSCSAEPVYE